MLKGKHVLFRGKKKTDSGNMEKSMFKLKYHKTIKILTFPCHQHLKTWTDDPNNDDTNG